MLSLASWLLGICGNVYEKERVSDNDNQYESLRSTRKVSILGNKRSFGNWGLGHRTVVEDDRQLHARRKGLSHILVQCLLEKLDILNKYTARWLIRQFVLPPLERGLRRVSLILDSRT